MKKITLMCLTCLSFSSLNAGMPSRELESVADYRRYLENRASYYNDLLDTIVISDDPQCMGLFMYYSGHVEAYQDALFWLAMIGRAIPMD